MLTLNSKLVTSLPGPCFGLKAAQTASGDINFVVNCLAYANGSVYNPELVSTPACTGRVYDSIFVPHWDTWVMQERYAVSLGPSRTHLPACNKPDR